VKTGTKVPVPDKSGMWKKGMSRIETARSPFYLVAYLGKEYQKNFDNMPKGCRVFGIGALGKEVKTRIKFHCLGEEEKAYIELLGGYNAANMKKLVERRNEKKKEIGWILDYVTKDYEDMQEKRKVLSDARNIKQSIDV
jgi:hypothetical protein